MSEENKISEDCLTIRKSRKRKIENDIPESRSHSVDHSYFREKHGNKKKNTLRRQRHLHKSTDGKDLNKNIEVSLEHSPFHFLIPGDDGSHQLCIKGNQYYVRNVPGDGNCLFHCLSLALHGNHLYVGVFRNLISRAVACRWDHLKDMANACHGKQFLSANDYLFHMLIENAWATACEINAAASVFKTNIITFVQGARYNEQLGGNEVTYHEVCHNSEVRSDKNIFLLLADGHFQLLQANNADETRDVPAICTDTFSAGISRDTYRNSTDDHNNYSCIDEQGYQLLEANNSDSLDGLIAPCSRHYGNKAISGNFPYKTNADTNDISIEGQSNDNSAFNNDKKDKNKCKNHDADNVYLPKEADIYSKCRKLGVLFQHSNKNETKTERNMRMQRNRNNIRYIEKKLNVKVSTLPDPPPLSENNQFNKGMDCIRSFELEQMSYKFNCCEVCKERRLNMQITKENICKRCHSDKHMTRMFSSENNMDPGEVPAELADLSVVEQQLICRIAPAIHVHMLKHGGVASSGHCVTFPQDVNEPSQILPKLPHEINIIKVRKQGKNDTSKEFRVRRYTVQTALQWLKLHNQAYSDIIISEERLNQLPLNDQLHSNNVIVNPYESNLDEGPAPDQLNLEEVSGESDSCVLLPEPSINICDEVEKVVEEIVGPEHGSVTMKRNVVTIPWPTRDGAPVSEFTTRYFFTLAFPCLFPAGLGDFYMNRPRTCVSLADWADHLIWYTDGRFAKHPYFKFIVHNMIMRKRTLEQSTYIVQQQLGDKHLSVPDIKEKLQKGDRSIAEKILYFGACLRGTDQYWAQRSKELRSLIQFQINEGKGLPSFFTTGSCAEYHFKPLRRLLETYVFETTGSKVDLRDRNVLFATLQSNTHVVAHYFDLRTTSYFNKVMGPLFGVETFWYRQEFAKSRGMIHWHGLCWRSDREPHNLLHEALESGLKDDDCAQVLANWAKSEFRLTASHPAGKNEDGSPRKDKWPPPEGTAPLPPEEKNPLLKLLMDVSETQESVVEDHLLLTNRINLHRCSNYCLRNPRVKGSNKTKICRMEFGSVENPGKVLRSRPSIVKDKNKCDRLELERDHPMLVQHSQFHTQGWRANGDISLILSRSNPDNPSVDEIMATEKYVSGYACKGNETTGSLVDLFNDMANAADEAAGATAKSLCTKLLMNTVKRDVSAVEASFELSSIPLYRCSHQFQRVSLSGSRVLERSGSTLTKNTSLDKYLDRPKEDKTSWYEFICKSGKVPVVSGGAVRATWPLTEDYCRTMLLLHWKNWRSLNEIKAEDETWSNCMQQFLERDVCPNFLKADVQRAIRKANENQVEDETSDSDSSDSVVEQPDWMELIAPNEAYADVSEEFKYDDGGDDYDWSSTTLQYPDGLGLKWLQEISSPVEEPDLPLKLPEVTIATLNKDQKFAYSLVMSTLFSYIEDPENFSPIRLIVAGTAGSGKSFLIKCLVHSIRKLFNRNKAVQVLCPTGTSANLISGVTYHSFLKIPTSAFAVNKELSYPDGSVGKSLQKTCEGIVALLVDERSLIGSTNLGWMEYHSRFAMNKGLKSTESWGGLPVVVFLGDDVQLPPVCDYPVYKCDSRSPAAMHGCLVWKEFNTAVTLTSIVRQDETQAMLREVLMGLREYKTTKEQALWLQQFQWDNLRKSHGASLLQRMTSDGLFVFPTHAEEWSHNKARLLEMNEKNPIAVIKAENTGTHSKVESGDKAGGLVKTLYLCRGAKVMLTTNIDVPHGLFNGSMGTVVDIIYRDGRRPPGSLPDVVMVNFPKYTGPAFIEDHPKVVPIVPVERQIDCSCKNCKRKQVPLRLGWGGTLHRCQGTQVGKGESSRYIVISPGPRQFESRNPGALFVAISRAKSAGDGISDPDFAWHPNLIINEDRLCHVPNTPTIRARKKEIARIDRLTDNTRHVFRELYNEEAFMHIARKLEESYQRHEE